MLCTKWKMAMKLLSGKREREITRKWKRIQKQPFKNIYVSFCQLKLEILGKFVLKKLVVYRVDMNMTLNELL